MQRTVQAYFDDAAESYHQAYQTEQDPFRAHIFLTRVRLVLELLRTSQGRVLDAGCGPGVLVAELAALGWDVWGLDAAPAMLAQARQRVRGTVEAQRIHWLLGDVEHLGLGEQVFDAVVCAGVMEYLETYEAVLRELRRVLKAGGTLIITVPNACSPFNLCDRFLMTIARGAAHMAAWVTKGRYRPRQASERLTFRRDLVDRHYLPPRLDQMVQRHGFQKISGRYQSYFSSLSKYLWPSLAFRLAQKGEALSRIPAFAWWGTGYVAQFVKCA